MSEAPAEVSSPEVEKSLPPSAAPWALDVALWNQRLSAREYTHIGAAAYQTAILEQYRIYVDIADRVAARRVLTNVLLVTLNTALLTAVGAFVREVNKYQVHWLLVAPLVAALVQCVAWGLLLRRYQTLAAVKWRVVEAFEERLPARAFVHAEWRSGLKLESGQWRRSLTAAEFCLPALFGVGYLLAILVVVAVRE